MKSYIKEFESMDKPSGYYTELVGNLESLNTELNAFNVINKELKDGLPFSVKDNLCVKGVESRASSKILKGYIPPFDATVVSRFKEKGFGFLGKTNMDEFGFGTFGTNSEKMARNPFDPAYTAGGSSSGAAIATSIMKYHAAIAESTGGSISAPAAFCGVVGFTPTYGVISRHGLIDYSNSLDKIGFMSRSSADTRIMFDAARGRDPKDSTSLDAEIKNTKYTKLTVINQLMDGVDKDVSDRFEKLLGKLEQQGFAINRVDLPEISAAIPAYYIISMAEASTNLARYTGFKYGAKVEDFSLSYNDFFKQARTNFGTEAKRRVILGTFVRSASVRSKYYNKALKLRAMLIDRMKRVLADSMLISPTMPVKTPRLDLIEKLTPVQVYSMDVLTASPNLCGFPHISFPYDYADGMPLGVQIVADHFQDHSLMSFTDKWEESFEYKFKHNLGEL